MRLRFRVYKEGSTMRTVRDEAITQVVASRLRGDRRIWGETIDVYVEGDTIYLVGLCDTEEQRRVAELVVLGVHGVRVVVNSIRVRRLARAI